MAIKEVASAEFDTEVVAESNTRPVVVDFWAPWCGPCRMISPIIEELDNEYEGKMAFTKVNTDENQDIASRYNVMSIPTLILFKGGEVKDTVIGVKSKAALKKMFDEHIGD
jgi:thioredoxin 1